jgi:hypothetical protein
MPGGLIQLVAYGAQDAYLTCNSQITLQPILKNSETIIDLKKVLSELKMPYNTSNETKYVYLTRDPYYTIYFPKTNSINLKE